MAEFIFDLQRFEDGAGDGGNSSGSGAGGDSGGGDESGGSGSGDSAWEIRLRKKGEIIFPMFMSSAEADVFSEYAYDVFLQAIADDTVSYYDIENGIADSFEFSRLLSGSTILHNDKYDTVNLVDTNVGNIIEYYTYKNGGRLSLVFDTGAILLFDLDQVSPWFNFANGESMVYSARQGQWLTGNEAVTEFTFWNTVIPQSGTNYDYDDDGNQYVHVDNFAVTQNINTAILNTQSADNILLYDATSYDVFGAATVTDKDITILFPTGGALNVETASEQSPTFYLADGTSYYYNRNREEWRAAAYKELDAEQDAYNAAVLAIYEKAAREQSLYEAGYDVVYEADATYDAAGNKVTAFPLSIVNNNYVYDASYSDTINFYDAFFANVVDYSADDEFLNFTFNNGTTTTIEYDYNFSPIIAFADGTTIAYDWYTETWGTPYYGTKDYEDNFVLSRGANSLVYQAGGEDNIYFADAVASNVTEVINGSVYLNIFFDTGAVVNVRYTDYGSPDFVFADGSTYYYDLSNNAWVNVYTGTDDVQDNFPVSRYSENVIRHAGSEDNVLFADATLANVRDIGVDESGYYVDFTFNTGETTRVYYTDWATPDFWFADGSRYFYDYESDAWGTYAADGSIVNAPVATGFDDVRENFSASIYEPNFFYHTGSEDSVYFTDATLANVANVQVGTYFVDFIFNTGLTTRVGYTDTFTPDFVFADDSRYYYSLDAGAWRTYDSEGNIVSADTASDGLWGDTFSGTAMADDIFVGTVGNTLVQNVDAQDTITFDAALSDIVATSVEGNTIAVAFNTGVTAVIETAGTSPTFNLASGESYNYDKQSASWKTA